MLSLAAGWWAAPLAAAPEPVEFHAGPHRMRIDEPLADCIRGSVERLERGEIDGPRERLRGSKFGWFRVRGKAYVWWDGQLFADGDWSRRRGVVSVPYLHEAAAEIIRRGSARWTVQRAVLRAASRRVVCPRAEPGP